MSKYQIGLDIGGTKVAMVLSDLQGNELINNTIASENNSAALFYDKLVTMIAKSLKCAHVTPNEIVGIGIGMPGIIDRERGCAIIQNNLPLEDYPICEMLQNDFPKAQVVMDNDVNVAALHEYKLRNYYEETMIYVTVSTGISSAIIHRGEVFRGRGAAGEIGFFNNEQSLLTLEEDVSGPAVEKRLQNNLNTTKKLASLLTLNSPTIEVEIQYMIKRLNKVLVEMAVLLDPHCIVIGGGVINGQPKLQQQLFAEFSEGLKKVSLFQNRPVRIEQAIDKDRSGVKGALSLLH